MNCPKCGIENPDDAALCSACGAELKPAAIPQQNPTDHLTAKTIMQRTSGLAIASLALSLSCIGAPLGLILGIIAAIQIDRNKTELKGMPFAVSGLVIGGIGIFVFIPIMAAILFPVFAKARDAARSTVCLNNVRMIGVACQMYASDHKDKFPPAAGWNDSLSSYLPKNKNIRNTYLKCPVDDTGGPSYAMNSKMSDLSEKSVAAPADTVLIFESISGKNLSGGPELFPKEPRHRRGNSIGFADGHVLHTGGDDSTPGPAFIWNPAALAPATKPQDPLKPSCG